MIIREGKTNWLYIFIILALATVAFAGILWLANNQTEQSTQFPEIKAPDETANWKVYKDEKNSFEFKYPEIFGANVWHSQFWPPQVSVFPVEEDAAKEGCPDIPADSQEEKVTINNINYSLKKGEDAGAGSLYSSYCYIAQKNQKNYVLYFVIWSHLGCGNGSCGAYCETQFETECKNLDRIKDIEKPIEKIVSTFKF